ncbi:pyocin activator PrtN family protein [Pseudomonas frederiksbergensis]|uniref:pyocin activator PrtN family protein n=1 Tax=Pseudomonas frederiksbergensis TaxID=104087 RepID=UPI002DB5CAAE|nr:pyocin activator PrtN family protein [Pseudomonas frederiksbergensis]WRV66617.1 pyocin activator PrtN family protein [Pseudomonas frederiksbergensis]
MNTLFLLMAQYNGQAVIPIDRVCTDYMNLTVEKFKSKRLSGEIDIPVVRLGANSQKAALGIHLRDLAEYIDKQREKATKEQNQLMGRAA